MSRDAVATTTRFRSTWLTSSLRAIKEARVEIVGWQCARSAYCRHAMRGVIAGMVDLFCTKSYLSELARLCTPTTLGYRCAWACADPRRRSWAWLAAAPGFG